MPSLIHIAIPAFLSLVVIESVVSAKRGSSLYEKKDTAASLSMGVGNVLIGFLSKGLAFGAMIVVYEFRIFEIEQVWWSWVLLFFAEDFSYYVFHRVSHRCRFFWASHVNHHTSRRYNLSTALRQTWTGWTGGFVFWLWLPLVGFDPAMIVTMKAVSLIYQFWIHTETIGKLGPIEWIFNTPSHHRVHHAVNRQYLDRNHAGVLIIWDRIFGTFEPEVEKPVYGITKNIGTFNPVRIAFHEWWAIACDIFGKGRLRDKIGYVFGPPGWKSSVEQLSGERNEIKGLGG
ncbi:MAG: sterol desaturase family protein [Planctomycetes bacterium]|nr:sterol desaturase family protein [Planctomycetota bacterium]